jgi:hypothetical protein
MYMPIRNHVLVTPAFSPPFSIALLSTKQSQEVGISPSIHCYVGGLYLLAGFGFRRQPGRNSKDGLSVQCRRALVRPHFPEVVRELHERSAIGPMPSRGRSRRRAHKTRLASLR